jgi:hypothetical protein
MRTRFILAQLTTVALLAACAGQPEVGWQGTVDTLPNGAILVTNPATGLWDSATAWRLREDLRIGAAEGEDWELFTWILTVGVDRWDRIYVLDQQALEIRVFDPDGRYVRTIGKRGGGPGEFRNAAGFDFDGQGRLWVVDFSSPRYSVFDTAGTFLTSYPRSIQVSPFPWRGSFVESGALYDVTGTGSREDRKTFLVRVDTVTGLRDTVELPRYAPEQFVFTARSGGGGSWYSMNIPFAPLQHWQLDPRGFLWVGVSDGLRMHQVTFAGDTTLIVQGVYDPVAVAAAERDSAMATFERFRDMEGSADASRVPEYKPAFQFFLVDDEGNLWFSRSLPAGRTGTVMDVFDGDGRYLGAVETDLHFERTFKPFVRRGALYGVVRDEMTVPYVVRLRIER